MGNLMTKRIARNDEKITEKRIIRGFDQNLLNNVIDKFSKLLEILIPNVQFTKQHVWKSVFEKYVEQHIESHNIVPDLYLQYIIDMSWENFVAEYLSDAVAISQDVCAQIRRECTDVVEEDPEKTKLRNEKKKADRSNVALRAENKQLKAVIEAEKLLRDISTGKKKTSKIDALMMEIKNAGNPIAPAKLKEKQSLKVNNFESGTSSKSGKKPTVKQTIKVAYENSCSWQEFLTTFDENFIVANQAEIKKFVKKLYGDDKIDDNEWKSFEGFFNKMCPYGDFNRKIYNNLVCQAEDMKTLTL